MSDTCRRKSGIHPSFSSENSRIAVNAAVSRLKFRPAVKTRICNDEYYICIIVTVVKDFSGAIDQFSSDGLDNTTNADRFRRAIKAKDWFRIKNRYSAAYTASRRVFVMTNALFYLSFI